MINTVTKAVIGTLAAFAALVETKVPVGAGAWIQDVASALGTGLLVWYVPNTAKPIAAPPVSAAPLGFNERAELLELRAQQKGNEK
jgi:hypothetical protein